MRIFNSIILILLSNFSIQECIAQVDCDIDKRLVPEETKLACKQGVYLISNEESESEDFSITKGYKTINLVLNNDMEDPLRSEVYAWAILYEGFGNFPQQDQYGNNIVDEDFTICDFQPSGPHYISTNESSIQLDGKLKGYEILTDYYCDAGSIEFYRMRMQYMEKLSYLPFRAYQQIKERSSTDQRNYLSEFNILTLLKKAKVTAKKAYFHDNQNGSSQRKAFVVEGDELIIDTIEDEWVKAAYEGKTTTLGWLKRSDLDIL